MIVRKKLETPLLKRVESPGGVGETRSDPCSRKMSSAIGQELVKEGRGRGREA